MFDQLLNPTALKWGGIVSASAVLLLGALLLVWFAGSRYGKHHTTVTKDATARATTKDRLLFAAALVAGATVYAGFVIGSYQGLTGFARDYLGWSGWLRNIVPITLDGGAAAFAFLAFRAVARSKSPLRCYAIVWTAAGASASFNYIEGGADHTSWGGAYLAFLSLAGMSMFHTFLDQFRGAADLATYPKFGLRWATYLPNTACAALAWINHPVAEGVEVSVANAVEHLDAVRARKREQASVRRVERAASGGWTLRPWTRTRDLTVALAASRTEAADTAETLSKIAEEFSAFRAERVAERAAETQRTAEAERRAETLRVELVEMAETVRALRAEHTSGDPAGGGAETPHRAQRSGGKKTPERPLRAVPSGATVSDEEAVQRLLDAEVSDDDKKPGHQWSKNQAIKVTGVGWSRVDNILTKLAERRAHDRAETPRSGQRSTGSDDSEERAV